MIKFFSFLLIIWLIILVSETFWRKKLLKGEGLRKLAHGLVATFVAFWPYFLEWKYIQLAAVMMLLGVLLNRSLKKLHILGNVKRITHGDVFFALGILACSLMTTNKAFFAIGMLHLAWADAIAAVVGVNYGMKLKYKVFGHTKTILGTFAFWATSFFILSIGLWLAKSQITFDHYILAILALPPILALIENFSVYGADNLVVPVAVIFFLQSLA